MQISFKRNYLRHLSNVQMPHVKESIFFKYHRANEIYKCLYKIRLHDTLSTIHFCSHSMQLKYHYPCFGQYHLGESIRRSLRHHLSSCLLNEVKLNAPKMSKTVTCA